MKKTKLIQAITLFFLFSVISISVLSEANYKLNFNQLFIDPSLINLNFNISMIDAHLKYLTGLGTRYTGYEGFYTAAKYIAEKFTNYGLNVSYHNVNVTIPVDYGANITIVNRPDLDLHIYPLQPNLVCPVSVPNLTAPLVDVTDGILDGKNLDGAIAILEFNTGYTWINIAKFGGKAVIFIEPESTQRGEIETKYIPVPFNFPRFYMKRADAQTLLKAIRNSSVPLVSEISSLMKWEAKVVQNIIGILPGASEQIILLTAYYDSGSIAPSVAPGAEQACGIATLLELARTLAAVYERKYTIWFVAYAGHFQSLWGAQWFIKDYILGTGKEAELGKNIILQIHLQISTRTNNAIFTNSGVVPREGIAGTKHTPFNNYVFQIVDAVRAASKKDFEVINGMDIGSYPYPAAANPGGLDSNEVTAMTKAGPSFSFTTSDYKDYIYSPIDYYEILNINNLNYQLEVILPVINVVINTDELQSKYLPGLDMSSLISSLSLYLVDLMGRVAIYNTTKAWYEPVPGAIAFMDYSSGSMFVKTDENGFFHIPNTRGAGFATTGIYPFSAFKVDDETGNLIYGPDFGKYRYALSLQGGAVSDLGYYTISKCSTVILFDFFDPHMLATPPLGMIFLIVQHETSAELESFGYIHYALFEGAPVRREMGNIAVVFIPPGENVEIIIQAKLYGTKYPLGYLINASSEYPDGYGYRFDAETQYVLSHTPLRIATDMYYSTLNEMKKLERYGVQQNLPEKLGEIHDLLNMSNLALKNKEYEKMEYFSIVAWGLGYYTYASTKGIITDMSDATTFFALLLIPFTLLVERLLFRSSGLRRIASTIIVFLAFFVILYIAHPAFSIMRNIMMIILGFVTLTMTSPLLGIIYTTFFSSVRRVEEEMKGLHFADISRSAASVLSLDTGIENLRKRKLRSALTFLTIMLIVTGITLFSSVSAERIIRATPMPLKPAYQGIYIRPFSYTESINIDMLRLLQSAYGDQAKIFPITWLYTTSPDDTSRMIYYPLKYENKTVDIYAMVGIAPDAIYIDTIKYSIIRGRWFLPTDYSACIITNYHAKRLGIESLPAKVSALGLNLTVIGILDMNLFDKVISLDNEMITPLDYRRIMLEEVHVFSFECILLPYSTLATIEPPQCPLIKSTSYGTRATMRLHGVESIVMIFDNASAVPKVAKNIFQVFNGLVIYYGYGDTVYYYIKGSYVEPIGWQLQIIPIILASFMVLNLLVGGVEERKREISTYASVGLSPIHIAFLFLAESLIYSIVGGMVGYIAGITIIRVTASLNITVTRLNYSAMWVILSVGIAMLLTTVSSTYPILLASKLVTPSLERKWKLTKPVGDEWEVPLPFKATSEKEAKGISFFMFEYLKTHATEGARVFSTSDMGFIKGEREGSTLIGAKTSMRLEPYAQGIRQEAQIILIEVPETAEWKLAIYITRIAGSRQLWIKLNRRLLDALRKQLLIWRSLKPGDRQNYMERAEEI